MGNNYGGLIDCVQQEYEDNKWNLIPDDNAAFLMIIKFLKHIYKSKLYINILSKLTSLEEFLITMQFKIHPSYKQEFDIYVASFPDGVYKLNYDMSNIVKTIRMNKTLNNSLVYADATIKKDDPQVEGFISKI